MIYRRPLTFSKLPPIFPLCNECKFFQKAIAPRQLGMCEKTASYDFREGKMTYEYADYARRNHYLCGPSGYHYKPKSVFGFFNKNG
jgi:hypothetical protein